MTSNSDNANMNELQNQLKWVNISSEKQKGKQISLKIMENPLVPIGCIATVAALTCGLWNFYKGNSIKQQMMMRCRVLAQGFTVVAMTLGLIIMNPKNTR